MSTMLKVTLAALAVAAGAGAGNAGDLLQELAAQGSIVTTHGIAGTR